MFTTKVTSCNGYKKTIRSLLRQRDLSGKCIQLLWNEISPEQVPLIGEKCCSSLPLASLHNYNKQTHTHTRTQKNCHNQTDLEHWYHRSRNGRSMRLRLLIAIRLENGIPPKIIRSPGRNYLPLTSEPQIIC